ncbi:uncharacterized protein A4U43_C04F30740 [Asparagus officinalis]|uniref:Uncharacterized protein n=1 Tax=Asparagus officinalis TaxID=4686 RepID=A0A5P1F4T3_ASPOF|nr:uncharacterized protein A4U43_C04F30740 [Asparagus officinalis]
MLEHAKRVKAIEIFVDHALDEPVEVIVDACDVLLVDGVSQPIDESITQSSQAQAQEATTIDVTTTNATLMGDKANVHAQQATTKTLKRKATNPSTFRKKLTPKRKATNPLTFSETLP